MRSFRSKYWCLCQWHFYLFLLDAYFFFDYFLLFVEFVGNSFAIISKYVDEKNQLYDFYGERFFGSIKDERQLLVASYISMIFSFSIYSSNSLLDY